MPNADIHNQECVDPIFIGIILGVKAFPGLPAHQILHGQLC